MKIEAFAQRVLLPDEGKWLYHAAADAVSDKVYLGKEADGSAWVEITAAEKEKIEKGEEINGI